MSRIIDMNIGGNSRIFFVTGDRTAIVDAGQPGLRNYGSLRDLKAALDVPVMAGWPDAGYMEKRENAPAGNLSAVTSPAAVPGPAVPAVKAVVVTDALKRNLDIGSIMWRNPVGQECKKVCVS
jgi:hypothetical protein